MAGRGGRHRGGPRLAPAPALALALALLSAAGACTPTFENATTVKDLRLLAVAAEPTEVLVDLPALMAADPATIEANLPRYQLRALVVDPAGGGRAISYRVDACGNDPLESNSDPTGRPGRVGATVAQAPCPAGSALIAEGSTLPAADGTLVLQVAFHPTRELLTAAVMMDPLGIELGLPLKLSFLVRAGSEEVVVVKRVLVSPRLSPEQTPNANPTIPILLWRKARTESRVAFDPAVPLPVPGSTELRIAPEPSEDEAEPYLARSYSRQERRFVTESIPAETLRYGFFATAGYFSPANTTTDTNPLRTNAQVDLESVWTAPAESGLVDVFVIVRDERTGTGWARVQMLVE